MNELRDTPPTSEEIDRRLRIVSELRNLCLSLGKARRIVDPPSSPDTAAFTDEAHSEQNPG